MSVVKGESIVSVATMESKRKSKQDTIVKGAMLSPILACAQREYKENEDQVNMTCLL